MAAKHPKIGILRKSQKLLSVVTIDQHKHECTSLHENFPGANRHTQSHWIRSDFFQKPLAKQAASCEDEGFKRVK